MNEELSKLIDSSSCPVSLSIHVGSCPELPLLPEPAKRLEVGSTLSLIVQWPAPDNWLACLSERLAGLLYRVGIRWHKRWGRWRLDSLEAKAEVIQDNAMGLKLHVTSGFLWEGPKVPPAKIEEDT